MRLLSVLCAAAIFVGGAGLLFCEPQIATPAPAYVVHISGVRMSAMSPDEKYLAVIVVHRPRNETPTAEVQLLDFRNGGVLKTHRVDSPALLPRRPDPTLLIRYTNDGQLLAVYVGGKILHVLRTSDLEESRTIESGFINSLEASPTDRRVAVRLEGLVRVFDLDSGEALRSWKVQPPEVNEFPFIRVSPRLDGLGLAWRDDGKSLAISVADGSPCQRGGGTIYVYDFSSREAVKSFRVPLLPGYVAFASGNGLYVASSTCGGYFAHWVLDLPEFDSTTGREIGKIPAKHVGVRGYVAISANKQTLVAFADREKTTAAGFEDTLETRDAQWQVWDLSSGKLLLTLPARAHMPKGTYLAVSGSGRHVYTHQADEVSIFSVPVAPR